LLEYIPDQSKHWEYNQAQWNGSWVMDCQYNESTPIPSPVAYDNCSNGLYTQIPWFIDNWYGWDNNQSYYTYDSTGWRNNVSMYRDWLIFTHGVQYNDWTDLFYTDLTVQTVATHLQGINATTPDGCNFGPGPITSASYTSMTCKLKRNLNLSDDDLTEWGPYPDIFDVEMQAGAYVQHYANRFRKESSREADITIIQGNELAMFYQAYLITKDSSTAPFVHRTISVHVQVAQISLPCLIACAVAAGVVLFGLFNYWAFLFRHWSRLDKTPQSKLDWMLHTLRKEHDDTSTSKPDIRKRLSSAMASGVATGEAVPLTNVNVDQKDDRRSVRSTTSSAFSSMPTPELPPGDDGFESSVLGSNFSGRTPTSTWFPQQYERVSPHVRQESWGYDRRNKEYNSPPQQSPYGWQGMNAGTAHVDTAYDPGRR